MKTVIWYELATEGDLAFAQHKALENNTQGLAFACEIQDYESLEAIRELLGDKEITAAQFETYTGDYTNIFVSWDTPSFKADHSWHKVYTFVVDDEPTKVNFRIDKNGVFALMPELTSDVYGRYCTCYQHVGGHSGADYKGCIASSKPATFEQYRSLLLDLYRAGYNVQPIKKFTKR